MGRLFRQTAEFSSRKLAVLEVFKRHYAERGAPPSISEIEAATGHNRKAVWDALKSLVSDGRLLHQPGAHRVYVLPEPERPISTGDALLQLQAEGWTVCHAGRWLAPPA